MSDKAAYVEGGWNFGPRPENEVMVGTLIERFTKAWGRTKGFEGEIDPSPLKEPQFLKLDIAKAGALLGWRPRLTFAETSSLTVDWFRQRFDDPSNAASATRTQLAAYCSAPDSVA